MALLDKKLYLADLETRLNAFVPANDVRRIVEQAADALLAYDMTTLPQDGSVPDDSDNLVKLFLDAKGVEGRSQATINHYRYVLGRLKEDVGVPFSRLTVHHLRSWLMQEQERGVSLRTLEGNRYVFTSFFRLGVERGADPEEPNGQPGADQTAESDPSALQLRGAGKAQGCRADDEGLGRDRVPPFHRLPYLRGMCAGRAGRGLSRAARDRAGQGEQAARGLSGRRVRDVSQTTFICTVSSPIGCRSRSRRRRSEHERKRKERS